MPGIRTPRLHGEVHRDDGAILPLVLVATIVFTLIVCAVAGLVTTGLRYGNVVEQRADRLAAADGGLRYGIERLRGMSDLCSTRAGTGGGYTTIFPPEINGATTEVTCRRVGNDISDLQGWGAVITGANVPGGQDMFAVKGAGGATTDNIKKFRGPVYVADPTRIDLQAKLIIDDGDLWYTHGDCSGALPAIPEMDSGYLTFDPSFLRGPACNELTWQGMFRTPSKDLPTTQALATPLPYNDVPFPGCRVFYPGKYTTMPALDDHNYFFSGDYYFENVDFQLSHTTATFGFPSGSGDTQQVAAPECQAAMEFDQGQPNPERGGATIWLGGSTHFVVNTGGELEIFRRQQNETYLSVFALESNGTGFLRSTYSFKVSTSIGWILETKSGNTNDAAIHGLWYSPYSKMTLGNITNASVGQLVGGLAIAFLEAQASNSADAFAIGIEGNPIETHFLLISTATKEAQSTTARAVVQFRPGDDARPLAINSWRVVD